MLSTLLIQFKLVWADKHAQYTWFLPQTRELTPRVILPKPGRLILENSSEPHPLIFREKQRDSSFQFQRKSNRLILCILEKNQRDSSSTLGDSASLKRKSTISKPPCLPHILTIKIYFLHERKESWEHLVEKNHQPFFISTTLRMSNRRFWFGQHWPDTLYIYCASWLMRKSMEKPLLIMWSQWGHKS